MSLVDGRGERGERNKPFLLEKFSNVCNH